MRYSLCSRGRSGYAGGGERNQRSSQGSPKGGAVSDGEEECGPNHLSTRGEGEEGRNKSRGRERRRDWREVLTTTELREMITDQMCLWDSSSVGRRKREHLEQKKRQKLKAPAEQSRAEGRGARRVGRGSINSKTPTMRWQRSAQERRERLRQKLRQRERQTEPWQKRCCH
jgi:hypothetical protein